VGLVLIHGETDMHSPRAGSRNTTF
jgi:hypothetical protein